MKANHEHLFDDLHTVFEKALDSDCAGLEHDIYETHDQGHGRQEYRCYTVLHTTEGIRQADAWAGLTTIGMCISERTIHGQTEGEVRYFIGNKKASAQYYGQGLRNHGGIENNLHWQLDVTFGEDANRVQQRQGAENLAWLRRLTLSLLRAHPAPMSMAKKRYVASLNTEFLEKILRGDGILEKR